MAHMEKGVFDMADFLIIVILLVIVGGAVAYIVKQKKQGVKCIGCPSAVTCSHKCEACGGRCTESDGEIGENIDK